MIYINMEIKESVFLCTVSLALESVHINFLVAQDLYHMSETSKIFSPNIVVYNSLQFDDYKSVIKQDL